MLNRVFKFIILSTFFLVDINLCAIDIYMDDFQIIRLNSTEDQQVIEESNKEILFLFENKLLQTTTNTITYGYFSDISTDKSGDFNISPIDDSLGALAACFFYNIDYILFGEIIIDIDNNEYFAIIKLYSNYKNEIIYDIRYSDNMIDQDDYFQVLANTINQELSVTLLEELLIEHEKLEQEKLEEEEEEEQEEEAKDIEEEEKDEEEEIVIEEDEKNEDKNSIIGFFTSFGYYYVLNSEWKEFITSVTSMEFGIKFDFEAADNERMDFHLRPGLHFNYSFAFNKDRTGLVIHYHSLLFRLLLEACFEFSDKFDFFIGSGVQYRFDIIDYQGPTNTFVTDIPYALGTFASLGFDFLIGKRKNTYIGVTNIFDFTFFNEIDVNTKFLLHFYFKF